MTRSLLELSSGILDGSAEIADHHPFRPSNSLEEVGGGVAFVESFEIIRTVAAPPDLLSKPYLRPIYDDPEFIVHNVWRAYGGWYDGNPPHLKPAREQLRRAEN